MADRDGWPSFTAALAAEAAGYTSRWGRSWRRSIPGRRPRPPPRVAGRGQPTRAAGRGRASAAAPLTIAGAAAGVALAATSTVHRALPEIEERLHTLVQ